MKVTNDPLKAKRKELGRDLTSTETRIFKRKIKRKVEKEINKQVGEFHKGLKKQIQKINKKLK